MFQSLFGRQAAIAVKEMSTAELHQQLQNENELMILDVRNLTEFEHDGRISEASLIPLQELGQRIGELPKDKTIVCVCRSGARSYNACQLLQSAGFENVINMSGGMNDWKRRRFSHL